MPAISTTLYRFCRWIGLCLTLLGAVHSPAAPIPRVAQPITRITAADAASGDQFSVSVAVHATTLLVGAYWDDDDGSASGSAYLFGPNEQGSWTELQKLTAHDAAANDWFGVSVALHGDLALVGAALQDEAGSNAGAAYLFQRDPANPQHWLPLQKLIASDAGANDWFGWEVALNDHLITVGAYQHDGAGKDTGAVYVFRRQPGNTNHWVETTKLTATGARLGSWLGFSLALHGNDILAGAPFDAPNDVSSGAAYLFHCQSETNEVWLTTRLVPMNPDFDQQFGWSVALHQNIAAIGARLTDYAAPMGGAVYLFQSRETSGWAQLDVLVPHDNSTNDWFGESLALSDSLLAVGVRLDDDQGNASGSAYLFQPNQAGQWRQTQKLVPHDGAPEFRFGESIAVDQDLLLVGSFADENPSFGFASGAAYVYALVTPSPALTIDPSPETIRVSWEPSTPTVLEFSTDLVQWTSLPAGLPPLVLSNEGPMKFFRLRQP